jgi:diaminopimelate decarboxylase
MNSRGAPFGHSAAALVFWRKLVKQALRKNDTPFYLFSVVPIQQALRELDALKLAVPVRHWLSFKTQPLRPLLQWWRAGGRGVEVVSEFELKAALQEGFPPQDILVNGPAKHAWLPRHAVRGLRVNFDSLREATVLLPQALRLDWSTGVRCHTGAEFDPETPSMPTQFGMMQGEAVRTLKLLRKSEARVETLHFHLRTNVASPSIYERALRDMAAICRAARFNPLYLDCGGGLPAHHVQSREGRLYDAGFNLSDLARMYRRALGMFPSAREVWLENGRFVSARSGVLVVRVRDIKERTGLRQLLCDGGRTSHALVSNWENHEIFTVPRRSGRTALTAVCGPTCMAFDQLARRPLPRAIQPGDRLVWMEAGAYHIPWETRFSHGYSSVLWHDGRKLTLARAREPFKQWWGQWR